MKLVYEYYVTIQNTYSIEFSKDTLNKFLEWYNQDKDDDEKITKSKLLKDVYEYSDEIREFVLINNLDDENNNHLQDTEDLDYDWKVSVE
jgi:hypothetical protein